MSKIFIFLFIVAVLSILLKLFTEKNRKVIETKDVVKEYFPYKKKWDFMTDSELSFFKQLEITVGDKYYIVPQVALSDILYLPKGTNNYRAYRSRIDKKSLDFVLFSKPDFKFVKAIELNDASHDKENRINRDNFVKKAMHQAGLELEIVDHRESFRG